MFWERQETYREALLEDPPQLLALGVAGILNLEVAALVDDLLGREGPLGLAPSRLAPPLVDGGDLLGEELVLHAGVHGGAEHVVGGHAGR